MKDNLDKLYYPEDNNSRGTVVSGSSIQDQGTSIIGDVGMTTGPIGIDKPIIGFLYSVSRRGFTEYWPLKLGRNMIGKRSDCDVCLAEKTVSGQHATLVIQQMKNPDKLIASIRDAESTNGTMVNGSNIGFDYVELKNGDVLTIGDHYQLLFILIDKKEFGLTPSEDFIPMDDNMPDSVSNEDEIDDFYTSGLDDIYKKGTVAYDGSSVGETGGTKVI